MTGEPMPHLGPTAPPSPDTSPPPTLSRDELLEQHVIDKVAVLQQGYLAGRSGAMASLARLRRAVNATPGSDPSIWHDTLEDIPSALLGHSDAPSLYEMSVHATLTLYAVHQQSRRESMHRRGYPMGRSVRLLAKRITKDDLRSDHPVMRRFHALGTATSLPETLHHLRGIITQLRSENIPLDYGRLAVDLRRLQDPRLAGGVRLQWSRDYHRQNRATRPETPTTPLDDDATDQTDMDVGDVTDPA